jgi:hypothetical protein
VHRDRAFAVISAGFAIAVSCAVVSCGGENSEAKSPKPSALQTPIAPNALRSPEDFSSIQNPTERSRALFMEASRVITSPRCVNCHPSDDSPRQREAHEMHDPPVTRGPNDEGVPGAQCTTCHQDENVELARVPGAPKWHLAPKEMAWLGKSVPDICEQIKDPNRNGHRSLAQLVDHAKNDKLVAWGWSPGADRIPAPGDQKIFGALVEAWVQTGAACPLKQEAAR